MRIPAGLRPWLPLLFLFALLGAAAAAYYPGLSGPFLLDDLANLPALGSWGPVNNVTTLVSYLTSGIAGPTGRPLALAAFLMDAHSWPANPWPFKLTNLLFHLLNGVLLAALLVRLSRWRGLGREAAMWAGVLGAGLWLVHPLFVSTTLYIVQRMTELAALFVFAGLLAYVTGRLRLAAGRARSGYALMICGLVFGTLLGALSKENALLLPLLALVLEWTVLRNSEAGIGDSRRGPPLLQGEERITTAAQNNSPSPSQGEGRGEGEKQIGEAVKKNREHARSYSSPIPTRIPSLAFRIVFLWLPSLALAAYLLAPLGHATHAIGDRDFTIAMRLLTEARVVVQYLYLIVIPHAWTGGLFSGMSISTGLLTPWTTLPCILLIVALIVFAFAVRRRFPALAAAILFYFAGQLLESTTIPLELYFEHRNYLPAALAFWPLALWIVRGPGGKWLRTGIAGLALAVLLALTAMRADLWGNGVQLALVWMHEDPDSSRAQVWGAQGLTVAGRPDLALATLKKAAQAQPGSISITLSRLDLACKLGVARPADLAAVVYAAGHDAGGSPLIYTNVGEFGASLAQNPCPPLTAAGLLAIPAAALANPHFSRDPALRQEFLVLRGQLLLHQHRPEDAFRAFAQALPIYPKPDTALVTAADLYIAHQPRLGLAILDEYERLPPRHESGWTMARLHDWWLDRTGWYSESFRRVRAALEEQLHTSGTANKS
ncbi:MAG: tetratricopeptide repeat protein [Gammaproteobacteria bacterium]